MLRVVLASLVFVAAPFCANAADVAVPPPFGTASPVDAETGIDFARRQAIVLLIRHTFSLLDAPVIIDEIASGPAHGAGPTEADQIALDRALLAEGSYYLVSLRYLVLAGGAAWPGDKAARTYERDALVRLDALQEELFEVVATRADPIEVFLAAQRVWAQTEGYTEVTGDLDVFGHRDALVEEAADDDIARVKT